MCWRCGLCFFAVVWLWFAISGQLLVAETRGELKTQLAMYPQELSLFIESAKESVRHKDVELAKKKLFFLGQRVNSAVVLPEEKLAYEKLLSDVVALEEKFMVLSERQKSLAKVVNMYPEHRDLLYLQGINEYNLMNDELAVGNVENSVDLDPLFGIGWDALQKIRLEI